MCIRDSKSLEYTKNWKNILVDQKIPKPNEILSPNSVVINQSADERNKTQIKKTTRAMKKVWTLKTCLLKGLKLTTLFFQSKYFGKPMWIKARIMSKTPIILSWSSIFFQVKNVNKRIWFLVLFDFKLGFLERIFPVI